MLPGTSYGTGSEIQLKRVGLRSFDKTASTPHEIPPFKHGVCYSGTLFKPVEERRCFCRSVRRISSNTSARHIRRLLRVTHEDYDSPRFDLPLGEKGPVSFSMLPDSHGLAQNHQELCKPSSQTLKCHCQIRRTQRERSQENVYRDK